MFGASRFPWCRVDEDLCVGIMRCGRRRRFHDGVEDGVKMVRELLMAEVDVDGRGEALNEQSLFDAPSDYSLVQRRGW